jgi:rsbT co-antagonist protein RsbR
MPTMALDPLADFFAYCPRLLFTATRDGAIVRLSATLARLLGREAGAGTRLHDRVHPEDLSAFEAGWAKLARSGEAATLEFRLREAEHRYRLVSCDARCSLESGEVHGELAERAERDKALLELKRDAEILYLLEENLPIGVWMIDRRGIFTRHEGKALGQLGFKKGQFVGLNVFESFRGQSWVGPIERAFEGYPTHQFAESGGIPWENWNFPVRNAEGEVTSIIGISLDVSEAKRIEKDLMEKIELVERQHRAIRALGTPIIEVWDKVLTLPMLGMVDSVRAAELMSSLLAQVSQKGARFAILDLTGVDAVDTTTAAHLIKLIHALRLLGAEGIITGIKPDVAQTMVALGLDLKDIVTLAKLRDGLRLCMRRSQESAA